MSKDSFLRPVEMFKENMRYRDLETQGGFYSEADMKKPVSEGGLGYPANHVLHLRLDVLFIHVRACMVYPKAS